MATADLPRAKKRSAPESPPARKKKSRAFRFGCWVTLLVLLTTGYFAPWIIANTPLRHWVLQSVLKVDGQLAIGSLSLGWFSGITAEGIQILDTEGEPLAEIASVSTDKPLAGLLVDFSDLGRIHVDRPVLHIVARDTDSNLEEALAPWMTQANGSWLSVQLVISEGTIVVHDVTAEREFRVEHLAGECTLSELEETVAFSASGDLPDPKQPGDFQLAVSATGSAKNETALASGKIDCQTSALPLELLEPILRRFVAGAQLSGRLSTRLAGAWGDAVEGGDAAVSGQSLATAVVFSAAALGSDRIELERVELPCHVVQEGDLLRVEQLGVECELGSLELSGSAKLSDLSAPNRWTALMRENYDVKGNVNLARLAAMLRQTLRIREGTEITSGEVALAVAGRQQADGMSWSGRVDASQLGAQAAGRTLVWDKPLAIEFATHETKQGLVLDRVECASTFLEVDASGTVDNLTATAKFDLAQLLAELRKFSDLDHIQLAGQGQAQLALNRSAQDQFAAVADFTAQGFQVVVGEGRKWTEERLTAHLDIKGQFASGALKRVDSALVTVEGGQEKLQAELQEAVADPAAGAWPLICLWRGQLDHWAPRLESCLGISDWDLSGAGALQAAVRYSAKTIEIEQAKADFTQFRLWGHDWFVREPAVSTALAGRWDREKQRLEVSEAKLVAGTTTAAVSQAVAVVADGAWALRGLNGQLTAELGNLVRWRHDPRLPLAWQVAGHLKAQTDLKSEAGVTSGRVDGTVDQFQLTDLTPPAPGTAPPTWREENIVLAARGSYQTTGEQWKFEQLQATAGALQCTAKGSLLGADNASRLVDLTGTVQYDWAQLAPVLRPVLGDSVQIAGRQTRAFALNGRVSGDLASADAWKQLQGQAAVGWTAIQVFGLQVGQGEVSAKLAGGQITASPIDVPISEGRLTFTPLVKLNQAPAHLVVPAGPLLTNVHLSPELCSRGLKFIAPVLSESTVADGRFSVTLDGGWMPLADPGGGDVSGRMAMRCQVKSGPLGQEFMVLLNELATVLQRGVLTKINDQSASLVNMDLSNVEFRMVNRRVYHRGLKFTAGTLPVTTYGSVGLDQSLAMVAEIPLEAKLLGIDLSLGALEGQTIQIPIEGTLQQPILDRHILQQLAGKLLQGTARGILIDGVNKQLERLLPFQQQ